MKTLIPRGMVGVVLAVYALGARGDSTAFYIYTDPAGQIDPVGCRRIAVEGHGYSSSYYVQIGYRGRFAVFACYGIL